MNFRNKRVALLINNLEGYYLEPIWRGVVEACRKYQVDLSVFEGRVINSKLRNEAQHNLVYSLADPNHFDGFILCAGTMAYTLQDDEFSQFIDAYQKKPLVTLHRPHPNASCISIDYYASLKALVLHVILDHKRKKIVYISGPKNYPDDAIRERAYRDAIKAGLGESASPVIFPGGFGDSEGEAATKSLISSGIAFDAIIYFNDELAQAGIRTLKEAGYRVPLDISITGFDNIESSQAILPSLTTAHQPLEEMGAGAVQTILKQIDSFSKDENQRKVFHYQLESLPVFRQSCGCLESFSSRSVAQFDKIQKFWMNLFALIDDCISAAKPDAIPSTVYSALEKEIDNYRSVAPYQDIGQVIARRLREHERDPNGVLKDVDIDDIALRVQMIHGAIMTVGESIDKKHYFRQVSNLRHIILEELYDLRINSLFEALPGVLKGLGITGCAIALFEGGVVRSANPSLRSLNSQMTLPERAVWKFCFRDGATVPLGPAGLSFPTTRIQPPGGAWYKEGESGAALVQPLFHGNEHFGFVVFKLSRTNELLFEGLRAQMSSIIKGSQVFEAKERTALRLKEALSELQQRNNDLKSLSVRDELTGLYNRRGFLELSQAHLHRAALLEQWICLFYLDLDNLKGINDQFGHEEGDRAIASAADLLSKTFRSHDIVARYGGDEFTILTVETDEDSAKMLQSRLLEAIKQYNSTKASKFILSMSMGVFTYLMHDEKPIEQLLQRADKLMYKEKSQRARL